MQRALQLAQNGAGNVAPNPMVGCVIVHNDTIIGEGWHQQYGGPHAEVNAVNSVKNPDLLSQSTVYVTLEPCAHYGKTPPCANLLVEKKVAKVVVACTDPNPLVAGKGIAILKAAGIDVIENVLQQEALSLNKRFFTFLNKKRPYIILKWAETADGYIARENFDSKWISNEASRMLVHKWRAEESAILVGKNTALHDNPSLTVRDWAGKNPVRIVIDTDLVLPLHLNLFTDKAADTICYNFHKNEKTEGVEFVKIEKENYLQHLLSDMYSRKLLSVLVEGGSKTLQQFISQNYFDEIQKFVSPVEFKNGIKAPIANVHFMPHVASGTDILYTYIKND